MAFSFPMTIIFCLLQDLDPESSSESPGTQLSGLANLDPKKVSLLRSSYRIRSINSRAYYSKTSKKIWVREFIRMRVLLNGVCWEALQNVRII